MVLTTLEERRAVFYGPDYGLDGLLFSKSSVVRD
jgi:hypothetical protein